MKSTLQSIFGIAGCIMALAAALAPASVQAVAFEYRFGDVFNGIAPVSTNRPWMDALFEDVSPGKVRLTLSNPNLTSNESVDDVYFNLNPTVNPGSLSFKVLTSSGSFTLPKISAGVDRFKAVGDGRYDLDFDFANAGTLSQWFSARDSVVYEISGVAQLTASDFCFLSTPAGGSGPFYAAVHVQRIGNSSKSGGIAPIHNQVTFVPEPAPGVLLMLGLALCRALRRAQRHQQP